MYSLNFQHEVYEDIKTAYDWYEEQRIGLGEEFLLTLEESYVKISRNPQVYQTLYQSVRRKLIRRFPYGVFFVINDNQIVIIAILHTKRNPKSLIERI